jgi:outer membrane protein OmpA-like peptidoglycan-associated protein
LRDNRRGEGTIAVLQRGGSPASRAPAEMPKEDPVKRRFVVLCLLLGLVPVVPALSAPAPQPTDKKGCSDPALFPTRMPGYVIDECDTKEYEAYELWQTKGPRVPVEGRKVFVSYKWPPGKPTTLAGLEIVRNYEAAITKVGGTIMNIVTAGPGPFVNGKIVKDGRELWVQVIPRGGSNYYWLAVVEKKAMAQHVVADAAAIGNDLNSTGHASIYGIHFDTGKAEVKPESAAALDEVAKLLAAEPALKLWVVGHTDWVGRVEDNMALSQARAEAVVKALTTTRGIAPARLRAFGSGPLAPVASNASEDGRARNRRVELVRQP